MMNKKATVVTNPMILDNRTLVMGGQAMHYATPESVRSALWEIAQGRTPLYTNTEIRPVTKDDSPKTVPAYIKGAIDDYFNGATDHVLFTADVLAMRDAVSFALMDYSPNFVTYEDFQGIYGCPWWYDLTGEEEGMRLCRHFYDEYMKDKKN